MLDTNIAKLLPVERYWHRYFVHVSGFFLILYMVVSIVFNSFADRNWVSYHDSLVRIMRFSFWLSEI